MDVMQSSANMPARLVHVLFFLESIPAVLSFSLPDPARGRKAGIWTKMKDMARFPLHLGANTLGGAGGKAP
ncbi:hypothetical protein, partial [Sagittula sp.]|uniref:hypothetical protein n=1 Tax=Sagittula sp. TaxID=2038081 RepID=UPI004057FDD9